MITTSLRGIDLRFETAESLFSPRAIDQGTLAMLSAIELQPADKVLDLGCGYGVVGILAARLIGAQRVTMVDNDPVAIEFAKANAALNDVAGVRIVQSDGFANLNESGFTKIICHPPYHVDFSVPKAFIEKGFNRLAMGGRLYMVTKRLDWYKNKIAAIFGGVVVQEIDGYFVFMAERRSPRYASKR
jgi:16S rRNA (guanine1207-N2)-methyltransferase